MGFERERGASASHDDMTTACHMFATAAQWTQINKYIHKPVNVDN